MNRRTFLKTAVGATALLVQGQRTCAENKASVRPVEPQPADDKLLATAKTRIEQCRKSDGEIVVSDANGRPVPNAPVRIKQLRHEFLFGCNFFMFGRLRDKQLEDGYRQRFAALFNYATLGFYWPTYEPERGKPNYDYTEQVLEWCAAHGVSCKGHPLVWDFADPKWLPHEFDEIRKLSHARVRECVTRFKGRLDIWDVVNEPTHLGRFKTRMGEWAMSLGAVPYVTEHLKVARAANPTATLLVNDYRTDAQFFEILNALREDGKLMFDAIGIQSHMHGGGWPLQKIWQTCDNFAALGVPIHFTETTVVSGPRLGPGRNWGPTTPELEARQAEYVEKFYTMLFAHPAVKALTWWDFSDQGAWQGAAAGLVRKDMTPKPVYERLLNLVKGQWWTKLQGRTDHNGMFAARAFCGTHRITAELPNGRQVSKEVWWQHGKTNRVELIAS